MRRLPVIVVLGALGLACGWNHSRLESLRSERDELVAERARHAIPSDGVGTKPPGRRRAGDDVDRVGEVAARYERLLREGEFVHGTPVRESLTASRELAELRRIVIGFGAENLGRLISRISSGSGGDEAARRSLVHGLWDLRGRLVPRLVLESVLDSRDGLLDGSDARWIKAALLKSVLRAYAAERPLEAVEWWKANRERLEEVRSDPAWLTELLEGVTSADVGLGILTGWELSRGGERVGWACLNDALSTDEGCLATLERLKQLIDSGQLEGLEFDRDFITKAGLVLQGRQTSLRRISGAMELMGWSLAELELPNGSYFTDRLDERETGAWLDWLAAQPVEDRAPWLSRVATGEAQAERAMQWFERVEEGDPAQAEALVREILEAPATISGTAVRRARLGRFIRDEAERRVLLQTMVDRWGLTTREMRALKLEFGLEPSNPR